MTETITAAEFQQFGKHNKYKAHKAVIDGHTFDSRKEAKRYCDLLLLKRGGYIRDLEIHPVFELQPAFEQHGKTHNRITYEADFSYVDCKTGERVIEDVKGVRTEVFNIKEKLFRFRYPELELKIVS